MKVLVTGGSGRAGKYVIKELVKRNHQVVNGDIIESHQNLENSKVKFSRWESRQADKTESQTFYFK